jgi:ELWxxDGT repeat protein
MLSVDLTLLKDINTALGSYGLAPAQTIDANGIAYFTADTPAYGREIWRSDGTPAGNYILRVILLVTGRAMPIDAPLVNANGTIFFAANDGSTGVELWKSDGTAAGTILVKDAVPGADGIGPTMITAVGDKVFFVSKSDLWKSDGTPDGTVLVRQFDSRLGAAPPNHLRDLNGTRVFTADDGVHGNKLWQSDGTAAGTSIVGPPDSNALPVEIVYLNGVGYYFSYDTLHRGDGSIVKDLGGVSPSGDAELTVAGNTLYCVYHDGVLGVALWKSDGTAEGTVKIKDFGRPRIALPFY